MLMAIMEEFEFISSDGSEELVREILDDDSHFFALPEIVELESNFSPERSSVINHCISTLYSGPRIEDFEGALSVTKQKKEFDDQRTSQPRISMLEKEFGKIENKYTLKIKSCDNGIADDGYKWRKYGQKSIKNSPNPRSYYKCTNSRCSAKKQVERSREEPDTFIITYEGLHLHFAYSHFFLNQPPHASIVNLPTKKPRNSIPQDQALEGQDSSLMADGNSQNSFRDESQHKPEEGSQGLLQDVVPSIIRNPLSFFISSSSPLPSSPPSSTSSTSSWSPNYFSDLV